MDPRSKFFGLCLLCLLLLIQTTFFRFIDHSSFSLQPHFGNSLLDRWNHGSYTILSKTDINA